MVPPVVLFAKEMSVSIDPDQRVEPFVEDVETRPRAGGVIFALVAIALILAIGFFYLTEHRRNDRRADAVTGAAQSVDDAARVMEEAARNAADRLRK